MLIKYWQGTDLLRLARFYPTSKPVRTFVRIVSVRVFWRLFHGRYKHWTHSERFLPYLAKYGIVDVEVRPMPPRNLEGVVRKPHDRFTVLCYLPQSWDRTYQRWVYGKDFIDKLKSKFPELRFVEVDGTYSMREVYPEIDLYVKFNRWGAQWTNRIALECEQLGIPVYRTDCTKDDEANLAELERYVTRQRKTLEWGKRGRYAVQSATTSPGR